MPVGRDTRLVDPKGGSKSISAESTFDTDVTDRATLERMLWTLAERLARRLREQGYAAFGVVLKLKTARFVSRTRARPAGTAHRLAGPPVRGGIVAAGA